MRQGRRTVMRGVLVASAAMTLGVSCRGGTPSADESSPSSGPASTSPDTTLPSNGGHATVPSSPATTSDTSTPDSSTPAGTSPPSAEPGPSSAPSIGGTDDSSSAPNDSSTVQQSSSDQVTVTTQAGVVVASNVDGEFDLDITSADGWETDVRRGPIGTVEVSWTRGDAVVEVALELTDGKITSVTRSST